MDSRAVRRAQLRQMMSPEERDMVDFLGSIGKDAAPDNAELRPGGPITLSAGGIAGTVERSSSPRSGAGDKASEPGE